MFDLTDIITRLQTETLYTIERAKVKEPSLVATNILPIVYVGFQSLDSENPSLAISTDLYDEHGIDLVQTFSIQINCLETNLSTIHRIIYKALIGWNPRPLEEQFSGFSYKQGGVIGLDNGRMWWIDLYTIGFPSLNVFP